MEKKLVLAVKQVGNAVIGYVLKQDEDLRDTLAQIEGFEIFRGVTPALDDSILYVRGDDLSADNDAFCYGYATLTEAEEIVRSIKRCVAKINGTEPNHLTEDGFEIIE